MTSWSGAHFEYRSGDAVVVLTHTAETVYAVRAREAALAAGVPVVSITGTGRTNWPDAIETVPPEQSETYTVSYTAAVAVLARLAGALGGPDRDLAGTVAAVRSVLAAPGLDAVPMPARSLAIIGAGPGGITAREGALKLREAARMLAEGFDAERFLHGNAVPYTAADGLVLLSPSDDLCAALGVAAAAEGVPVSTLDGDFGLGPVLDQIPATVRLQLLADRFAGLRGQDPDTAIVGAWAGKDLWTMGS
jgi:glucosamine--fructose-6-phosphate aminotransferase (isomerizing)